MNHLINHLTKHSESVKKLLEKKGLNSNLASEIAQKHGAALLDHVSGGIGSIGNVTANESSINDNSSATQTDNSLVEQKSDNHSVVTKTKVSVMF